MEENANKLKSESHEEAIPNAAKHTTLTIEVGNEEQEEWGEAGGSVEAHFNK